MSSETGAAAAVKAKSDAAGAASARLLPFLSPEVCSDSARRVLYNNARVRAACPVYQKGIIESSTVDVGSLQNRGILVVPHQACPIMQSHTAISGVAGVLYDASLDANGRLSDTTKGTYAGNDAFAPPYRGFQIPARITLAAAGSIGLPIHGSFYSAASVPSNALAPIAAVQFRDFTDCLTNGIAGGAPLGPRGIPAWDSDIVTVTLVGSESAAWALGDLVLDVAWLSNAGARTVTSFTFTATVGTAGQAFNAAAILPVTCVALLGLSLRNGNAATRSWMLNHVTVVHACLTTSLDTGMGLGSYTGAAISGLASLAPVVSASRLTALSAKVTNTASALNANGYIVGFATQDATPAAVGCYGESSIAGLNGSKSFKFVDGSYMAMAPSSDLDYGPIDATPPQTLPMGLFILQTQDNTAITFKIEYHALLEVVSQDPLFAPLRPLHDVAQIMALGQAQEASGYLILSENPFHWGAISSALGKAAKFAIGKGARTMVSKAASIGIPGAAAISKFQQGAAMLAPMLRSDPRPAPRNARPAPARQVSRTRPVIEEMPDDDMQVVPFRPRQRGRGARRPRRTRQPRQWQ